MDGESIEKLVCTIYLECIGTLFLPKTKCIFLGALLEISYISPFKIAKSATWGHFYIPEVSSLKMFTANLKVLVVFAYDFSGYDKSKEIM